MGKKGKTWNSLCKLIEQSCVHFMARSFWKSQSTVEDTQVLLKYFTVLKIPSNVLFHLSLQ